MSTQVQLLSTRLSLISVPIEEYGYFSSSVVKLLLGTWKHDIKHYLTGPDGTLTHELDTNLPARGGDNWNVSSSSSGNVTPQQYSGDSLDEMDEFINVSFTPLECSIICPTILVNILFAGQLKRSSVAKVLTEEYIAIQVDGDGNDTGSRVLDISAPLSAASISIFFIATYFSDYVLVPAGSEKRVLSALESRDFVFSNISNSYISTANDNLSAEYLPSQKPDNVVRKDSHASIIDSLREGAKENEAVTYSPSLVAQTLDLFALHGVKPKVEESIELLLTGVRSSLISDKLSSDSLFLSIVRVLLDPPKFFSMTINTYSEISFLVDRTTAAHEFPKNALLGSPTDFVIPVSFDLRELPEDATGIVAGVASILIGQQGDTPIHMSYLSTAKTGMVLVGEDDIANAARILGSDANHEVND